LTIPLPPGFTLERTLSERATETVVLARQGDRRVVLRLVRQARDLGAELGVLGRLRSPRLAGLVGGGTLPGGGAWLARDWVEGRDLGSFAALDAGAAAAVVADAARALDALHRRGFVHGDVKPANLVQRGDGQVVLTDFGLAGRAAHTGPDDARTRTSGGGRHGARGGTFGFAAPEVLVGGAAGIAADLFSLGATWLALRGVPLPPASELYGRFPAEPYVDAIGLDPATLDDESRDLLLELLHRDPRLRPSSALLVARRIALRFGLTETTAPAGPLVAPYWSHLLGRESFVIAAVERLAHDGGVEVWAADAEEEAALVAREAALVLAVRGRAVEHVDVGAELEEVADSVALDRWLARVEERAAKATLLVSNPTGPYASDVRDALLHLELERGAVWCVARRVAGRDARNLPPQARDAFVILVERALPGEPSERRERLVEALEVEARGSSVEAAEHIDQLFSRGRIVDDGDGARLAADVDLSAPFERPPLGDVRALRALPRLARRMLVAVHALGSANIAQLVDVLCGPDREELELLDLVRELEGRRLLRVTSVRGERRVLATVACGALELGLEREERRALHDRIVALRRAGTELEERRWASLLLGTAGDAVQTIVREAGELRERAADQRVRAGLARVEELTSLEGVLLPIVLRRELAHSCIALGDTQGAQSALQALENAPEARQAADEVRARLATAAGRSDEAIGLFERAGLLGSALGQRVQRAHYEGRGADVERLAREVLQHTSRHGSDEWPWTVVIDVCSMAAMSALRQGDDALMREWLRYADVAAAHAGNVAHVGALALNVGTAERRRGDLLAALEHHERAVEVYREVGHAAHLAQARLALSGVLRELGRIAEAEPLVHEALGTRRRLGDVAGAATARGMLGLLLADRGHLAPAVLELERAGDALEASGRSEQARLVQARAEELRARLGRPSVLRAAAEAPTGWDADPLEPRIALALGRAAWCRGDLVRAEAALREARTRAEALGRAAVAEEAELVLALLLRAEGGATHAFPAEGPRRTTALTQQDRALVQQLDVTEFDGRELLESARMLVLRGREDRGARAALAVAARDTDVVRREAAATLARSALERALLGTTPDERERATATLLGCPDPWPRDLVAWQDKPEDEMDVLTVLGINERLVEQQDLETLLGAIVDAALEVTGAERGFIVLEENGELSLDRALDSLRGDLAPDEVEYSQSIVRAALARNGALRIADAGDDALYGDARSVSTFQLRSVLCQPFNAEDALRGVIVVDDRRRPGAFGPREERLLGLLAGQAALAVRQVRRFERIMHLKDELAARVVDRETRLAVVEERLAGRGEVPPVEGLVGEAPSLQSVHALLRKIAPSELAVLVSGESGTGKELAARALHALSRRAAGPFVAENCAALPATLLESELFGSRKGSYTGSERDREGLFERASGGTLFLDEIGELPLDQQAKLLRVLETHEVRRIGDTEVRKVDFRLVAATNRDLTAEVQAGRFREDLLYRLDTVRVVMPPLRERLQDLPLLVAHFLRLAAARDGRTRRVTPDVLTALAARPWPGNVRELANEVARLVVLSDGDLVDPALVRTASGASAPAGFDLVRPLEELERDAILAALTRTNGDKRRAAELLGISRAKVYQRLKDWRQE
jgi:transcriptional regulator with GAF, ATPase, and Fis domain/tetratricopeptide (TPR) repeat protein